MGALSRIQKLIRRFGRARGGNFAMMMGLSAPVLVLAAGYGVNLGQVSLTKSNLLAALDSAVTSTARDLTTGVITEEDAPQLVKAFLIANGLRAYAEEGRLNLDSLVIDRTARTVSARASVELDVAFALFGSGNTRRVVAESAAIYSDKKIEVAMMLDLTGSMKKSGNNDKLGDLQTAARNAVDALLGGNRNDRVRVALVPYANSVNVGSSIARQAVYIEKEARDRTDKQVKNTDPLAVTSTGRPDNCATERKSSSYRYRDDGPDVAMVNRDFFLSSFSDGDAGYAKSVRCPAAAVVPLTSDATKLKNTINSFVADGGTGGHIGVQWTWYMLSEKWKNVVGTTAAAGPYHDDKIAKYAILMTDGEFNLEFAGATTANLAYGNAAATRSIPHAKQLCSEMRRAGITVFTIGFQLPNQSARNLMRDCATPDTGGIKHYFDTSSGSELNQAFTEIVRNIENLALTK